MKRIRATQHEYIMWCDWCSEYFTKLDKAHGEWNCAKDKVGTNDHVASGPDPDHYLNRIARKHGRTLQEARSIAIQYLQEKVDGKDKQAPKDSSRQGDLELAGDSEAQGAGPRHQVGRPGPIRLSVGCECPEYERAIKEIPPYRHAGRPEEALSVEWQEKAIEVLYKEVVHLTKALIEIHDEQGKVCLYYDLCNHEACRSSNAAWVIADTALSGPKEEDMTGPVCVDEGY